MSLGRIARCLSTHGLGIVLLAATATRTPAQETGYRAEGVLCQRPSGFASGVRARTPQGPTLSVGLDHDLGAIPVFALADIGVAGAGASLGGLGGMIGCAPWGDLPLGLSLRGSAIRTYGSPKGSRVEPKQTYVGAELTLHLLLSVGVGVFSRVAGPARDGRLVTLALGAGF